MIEAFVRLMDTADAFTGPVNIGNPGEFTILELATRIIELTSSRSEIIRLPLPSDDPKQRQPDISLVKQQLDWQPQVDLILGLRETIDYFKKIVYVFL